MAACEISSQSAGTLIRVATQMDCHAELLGRDGFIALAEYSRTSGLVGALLTISIAIVGYRVLFRERISPIEGASWAFRLGFVLAVLSGWTVFQTLFFDVAVRGPDQVATILANSNDTPSSEILVRIQDAYDAIRLGVDPIRNQAEQNGISAGAQFQKPMALASLLFGLTTVGLQGALNLGIALLLAVGIFPILGLLLKTGVGLFVGWVRTLVTAFFVKVGLVLAGSLQLLLIEAEIQRLGRYVGSSANSSIDSQSILLVTLIGAAVSVIILIFAGKFSSAIVGPMVVRVTSDTSREYDSASMPSLPDRLPKISAVSHLEISNERATQLNASIVRMTNIESKRSGRADVLTASASAQGLGDPLPRSRSAKAAMGRRHRSSSLRDRRV